MHVQRRHFDQLNTPKSWSSPSAVIAHIDLDAFYAQCLGVHYKLDPSEPIGCRQWDALIAINYPARKFGLKRGVSVEEARRLCPNIHLPHVATFRKGELHWDFHDQPDQATYKISLDHFRRESRKIFGIFKERFKAVEKAGIDEGFVDLGQEVYEEALRRHPDLLNTNGEDETRSATEDRSAELPITHDELLDIGADLVRDVRNEIYERLHYTCSAGIAPNKQLAKLGSGYNKPNNQTVVHTSDKPQFLSKFKITDAWGWGGKLGKEVLAALKIGDDVEDQCQYVREQFSKADLQHVLKGDVNLARSLYDMVRGEHIDEFKPRTLIKSMVAVKNFSRASGLKTFEDVEAWILVFAADISGRLWDIQEELGSSIVPKTITVRQYKNNQLISKQQKFRSSGTALDTFREDVFKQALAIAKTWILLPCTYLVVEVSNLYELPRERLDFHVRPQQPPPPSQNESSRDNRNTNEENDKDEEEESLFVENDASPMRRCPECNQLILEKDFQEHQDWHFAKKLQQTDYASRPKQIVAPTTPKSGGSSPSSPSKKKKKPQQQAVKGKGQKSILEFFNK